jgi:hypothetical protein
MSTDKVVLPQIAYSIKFHSFKASSNSKTKLIAQYVNHLMDLMCKDLYYSHIPPCTICE